jgi:hypothetical protein
MSNFKIDTRYTESPKVAQKAPRYWYYKGIQLKGQSYSGPDSLQYVEGYMKAYTFIELATTLRTKHLIQVVEASTVSKALYKASCRMSNIEQKALPEQKQNRLLRFIKAIKAILSM